MKPVEILALRMVHLTFAAVCFCSHVCTGGHLKHAEAAPVTWLVDGIYVCAAVGALALAISLPTSQPGRYKGTAILMAALSLPALPVLLGEHSVWFAGYIVAGAWADVRHILRSRPRPASSVPSGDA